MNNSKHFTSVRENNEGVDDNKCENYFMTISNLSSNMDKSFNDTPCTYNSVFTCVSSIYIWVFTQYYILLDFLLKHYSSYYDVYIKMIHATTKCISVHSNTCTRISIWLQVICRHFILWLLCWRHLQIWLYRQHVHKYFLNVELIYLWLIEMNEPFIFAQKILFHYYSDFLKDLF